MNHNKITYFCAVITMATMCMLQAQNTTLPVGAIPGTIDVSPMGAATYTIPIEVVPGTQGIQPNLSIVYNSFSGMGLLGMKWNLAGLSAITRCGQTLYYDNKIETIKFNSDDKFALDGNRLITIQGTYGAENTVYATEMEDFTRVVSYGGILGRPNYFIAYTDDGSMIEYGNTTDSKQTLGTDKVLSWYINKITDVDGNYMTYNYGSADGEIWITSIQYTGNSGMSTYAKVEFGYASNGIPDTLGRNTAYFLGYQINQTKLLTSITVKHNSFSDYVRKYEFNYVHENAQDAGRTVHLDKITEYGEGGNLQLNSTNITWGSKYTHLTINILSQFNITDEKKILSGDFDGDGYSDILIYNNSTKKGWQIYMYNPSTNSYPSTPTYSNSAIKYEENMLYAQDINGDGKDEVIVVKKEGSEEYNITAYSVTSNYPSSNYLESVYNVFYSIYFGDFDGDGITDIMFVSYDSHYEGVTKYHDWKFKFCSSSTNQMPQINFSLPKSQCDPEKVDIQVMNFNGNGKQNIAFFTESISYVFEYDGTTFQYLNNYIPLPQTSLVKNRFYGDVNGDGITDMLEYITITGKWVLNVSKGNGYFHNISLENLFNSTTDSKGIIKNKPMFVDLNGDGKQDIIQGVNYYALAMFTKFLFIRSQGYSNGLYKYEKDSIAFVGNYCDQKFWRFGDFFGNGKQELLIQDSPYSLEPLIFYQQHDKNYEFVQEITDGMGKKIELDYEHKYYRFLTGSVACPEFKGFLSTVKNLKVSNGIGSDKTILQYKYNAPKFSWNRRTLMGFEGFSCTNTQNNKKDTTFFVPNWKKEIMLLFNQKSYNNTTLISERRYIGNYNVFNLSGDRFGINYECIHDFDYLTKAATATWSKVTNHGRLMETQVRTYKEHTYNGGNPAMPGENGYMNLEIKNYYYQGICSTNNSQRAVLTKVVSTQQYKNNGTVVADSVMYEYDSNWHLYSETKENADGTITTKYENYTPKGLCQTKTVLAQGVTSRSEDFTFDATSRFVSTATNPLGHTATITYDPKTGNKLTETDANQLTTTYTYDGLGNLRFVTYPDNTKDTLTVHWKTNIYSFPANARYFTKTRSTGKGELRVYYDILGRELCRWSDGYYFDTRYNEKGQVVKTSYPYSDSLKNDNLKIWNEYFYDTYGRKQKEIAPYTYLIYSYDNKKVTVVDSLRGVSSYKDYDALGRIIEAKDEGGIITYQYSLENDKHKTVITINGTTTTIISDLWGNRISITEPNAGTITSEYNKFNELKKQTDANGNTTFYSYDPLGRVISKNYSNDPNSEPFPPFIIYTYDTGNKAKGKLSQIDMGGSIAESFSYDHLGRLFLHSKYNDGKSTFNYSYNSIGQLQKLTYPSGFAVNYTYTYTGKLQEIRRSSDNSLIYKVNSWNEFNQPIEFTHGNGLSTYNSYNQYGRITGICTGERPDIIINYYYDYDTKGLMTSRDDYVMQNYETFTYDNLDRLTQTDISGYNSQTLTYHNNGNILTNSLVGSYDYFSIKPHAVRTITQNSNAPIPSDSCAVTYNLFNQPTKITEGDYRIDLFYGANQQRNKAVFKQNDTVVSTRYYFNKRYEKEVNSAGETLHYNYIYGPTGVVALQIGDGYANNDTAVIIDDGIGIGGGGICSITPTIDNMYYIHTDHLGSYIALTDARQQVVQRNTFDPWGNYQSFDVTDFPITARGFTGHEHYPMFKIINMNGRLYDPVIGRFFSPDKYIANSSFTQDFNRYTYARNNPLMYTDPEGEFVIVAAVIGAFIGAMINVAVNANHITKAWHFFAYAGIGGAAGFGAGAAGVGVGAALGAGTSIGFGAGFGAGFASGFVSGFAGGFATSSANTWLQGGSFGQGLFNGFKSGMISGAISGLTAGIAGGIKGIQTKAIFYSGCEELGVDPKAPIPKSYRNSKFVEFAKNRWYRYALDPSEGYVVENGGPNLTENGIERAGSVMPIESGGKFTGGSTMYLHEQLAFTSAKQLFRTLGHELVHVSQFSALSGEPFRFYKMELFRIMLDHYASLYTNELGGNAQIDFRGDWSKIFPDTYKFADYNNFWWTRYKYFW